MYYYSPALKGFFHPDHHVRLPMDRVEITDEQHAALMKAQAEGKAIAPGEDGFPEAAIPEPQPPTPRQRIAALEAEITPRRLRDALLDAEEPKGWLEAQEEKIAALRRKIK